MKTLFQCDFDGTITVEDVSFLLLDTFVDSNWREMLKEYQGGKMSVGAFNTRAFALINASKETLLDFVLNSGRVQIRPGFQEMLDYCAQTGLEFVIVSNGQDFYINAILKDAGISNVKFFAATSRFSPAGVEVHYIGPEGKVVQDSFKETYTQLFLSKGYRVIYAGNGLSDIYPAKLAYHTFATGDLLKGCQKLNLSHTPFDDLNDIVKGLELLKLS